MADRDASPLDVTGRVRPALVGFEPYDPAFTPCRINLSANENTHPLPASVTEAMRAAAVSCALNRYPDPMANGLRDLLAAWHGVERANVMVGNGGDELLFNLLFTFGGPGHALVTCPPDFSEYANFAKMCETPCVEVWRDARTFEVDADALVDAARSASLVILTSPNNPTGCMYTKETLDAIHDILKDKPIFVLCDDVYRTLTYTDGYHSFSEYQDMRDRIIVIQSFSKPYAMTGWRLGYCMADAKLMDRIQVFHQYCVTSVPSFVQRACVTALETDTSDVVEIFRKRRDYVYQRLIDMGLDVEKPEGAFYMFVDIRKFGMDSNTFCTRMLKEGLVGVIPGIHFGTEGFMRLSYCYSDADLKEGLDRIEKFIKSL